MSTIRYLILLIVLVGCSPKAKFTVPDGYTHDSGDLADFLSAAVQRNGGKAPAITARFDAEWWSKADTNGFQILLGTNYQTGVETCLRQLYGNPVISSGYPHWLYRSTNVGVTISALTQDNPIHIIATKAGVIHDDRLPIGDKPAGQ